MIPTSRPSIGSEELQAAKSVFETGWLGQGSNVFAFEEKLKHFLNAKYVIAVNSGTAALHITLDGFGIGEGDEIIVPSLTNPAPIQAIIACRAKPIFCDVSKDTLDLDIKDVKRKITARTKVIMPVHFNGIPNKMDEILEIAKTHHLKVIEDAAHGFGLNYKEKKLGTIGDAGCFSFDPIKIITCIEGGAIVTNNARLAKTLKVKRNLGIDVDGWNKFKVKKKIYFPKVIDSGYRCHMNDINAVIGLVQLKKINKFIKKRKWLVERYNKAFMKISEIEFLNYQKILPPFYIIKIKKGRDKLMKFLKNKGIGSTVYFIPNHLQPFFKKYHIFLPVTDIIWKELITLPLYYDMRGEQQDYIIKCVKSFFNRFPK